MLGNGNGRSRALAGLDALGDSAQLRVAAQRELRAAGGEPPADRQEGVDGSGAVRVVVDRHRRVTTVAIEGGWRRRLQPGALAGALFDAYTEAVRAALAAAALHRLADGAPPPAAAGPDPLDPVPDPDLDPREWREAAREALNRNARRLRQAATLAAEATARGRERVVRSPAGCFAFHLRGRGATTITGDTARVAAAETDELRADAVAGFAAAGLADR
jgi:hypothetical protein